MTFFYNRKLNFFIEQLNWHYKQKHFTFSFPKSDLVLLFLRFLLNEGFIYGFSSRSGSELIDINLKYVGGAPIIREIKCFPKSYWNNFSTAKQLATHRTDNFLQSHLLIVFTMHGFCLLRDVFHLEGGWLFCKVII